jgi:hypothetical protein
MHWFKGLNIYLLALVILFGSILNVHTHHDELGCEVTESSKAIEDSLKKSNELLYTLNFILFNPYDYDYEFASQVSLPLNESHSHNYFTTFRLLTSNRIALPPPSHS